MSNVFVRRAINTSGLPDEYVSGGKNKVGSCAQGDSPLTGLTEEEIDAYMPRILGVSVTHPDFLQKVRDYFENIGFDIPSGSSGLKLNIAIRQAGGVDETVSARGKQVVVPENHQDYIRYKYLLAYPDCANTEEESLGGSFRMFLFDEAIKIDKEHKALVLRKAAKQDYLRISADPEAMDQVLLLLGEPIHEMSEAEKDLAIERFANNVPESFSAKAKDKNLVWKSKVHQMVSKEIIERSGNTFLFGGEVLGQFHNELDPYRNVVIYMKDKVNSDVTIRLFAKLGEDVPNAAPVPVEA